VTVARTAFFLETPRGRRFCIETAPAGPVIGAMLYFPPFAEEMNRSRRMAALAARAFAAHGWRVLQADPGGCGDSDGDFGDASWQDWIDDMDRAWRWLVPRAEGRRVLWTLRAGCLLAADWLRGAGQRAELLAWQPVLDGERHLRQFLRLELARRMLAENDARTAAAQLRCRLDEDETIEVAGYALGPALARGLAGARFDLPVDHAGVDMIELGREKTSPSPALAARAASMTGARLHRLPGEAFWQAQEIIEVPALIEKSLAVLDVHRTARAAP
jgi:exosortase A-associated hydrolase 2